MPQIASRHMRTPGACRCGSKAMILVCSCSVAKAWISWSGGVRLDVEVVAVAEQRRRALVRAAGSPAGRSGSRTRGARWCRGRWRGCARRSDPAPSWPPAAGRRCRGTRRGCGRSRESASWCRPAARAPSSDRSCDGRRSGRRPSWLAWSRGMSLTSRTSTDFTQRSSVRPVGTEPIEPHLSGATAGTKTSGPVTIRSGLPSSQPSSPIGSAFGRRQVGEVAARRAAVGPPRDRGDLVPR